MCSAKFLLNVINGIFASFGLGVVGIGVYASSQYEKYAAFVGSPANAYGFIILGVFVFLLSCVGIKGVSLMSPNPDKAIDPQSSIKKGRFILSIYVCLMLVLLVLEIAFGLVFALYINSVEGLTDNDKVADLQSKESAQSVLRKIDAALDCAYEKVCHDRSCNNTKVQLPEKLNELVGDDRTSWCKSKADFRKGVVSKIVRNIRPIAQAIIAVGALQILATLFAIVQVCKKGKKGEDGVVRYENLNAPASIPFRPPPPPPTGAWTCKICTFDNHADYGRCAMCGQGVNPAREMGGPIH